MIFVILAIGGMLFTIREITKMETQEFRVMIQLTLDVDINKTKEDVKNLVSAYIINEKCEHIDVMMKDIMEIREESEIYGTE